MPLAHTLYHWVSRILPVDITRVLLLDVTHQTPVALPAGYNFVSLDATALRRFNAEPSIGLNPAVIDLVDDDNAQCMAALYNGELSAYVFFSQSPVDAHWNRGGRNFNGIGLSFAADVRYLFKAFVLPAHRGKRLNQCLLWQFVKQCASHRDGPVLKAVVTTTDWTNNAFLRSSTSSGFTHQGFAAEWVIGDRHFYKLPAIIHSYRGSPSSGDIEFHSPLA